MTAVRAEITLNTLPERAIRAFLNADDLCRWWGVERSLIETRVGGLYAIAWDISPKGFHFLSTGVIAEYEPSRLLQIDHYTYFNPERSILGPMSLKISAQPQRNGQTLLSAAQDGYRTGPDWDWYYESVLAAWPVALKSLKKHLER